MSFLKSFLKGSLPVAVFLVGAVGTLSLLKWHTSVVVSVTTKKSTPRVVAAEKTVVVPGLPTRLKIPKLNIDAPVDSLGLTPDGDLDTPKTAENTGWYNAGPKPGEVGSAVIDGHFGYANNKPAVFDYLHTLVAGDVFHVEDEHKVTRSFVVRESRIFGPEDDATVVFRSSDNLAHLNLITCQGIWSAGQESYSTRLVVFADAVVE